MIRTQSYSFLSKELLQKAVNSYLFDYKISQKDLIDIKYDQVLLSVEQEEDKTWGKIVFLATIIHNVKIAKFKFDEQPEEKREYKINNNH